MLRNELHFRSDDRKVEYMFSECRQVLATALTKTNKWIVYARSSSSRMPIAHIWMKFGLLQILSEEG